VAFNIRVASLFIDMILNWRNAQAGLQQVHTRLNRVHSVARILVGLFALRLATGFLTDAVKVAAELESKFLDILKVTEFTDKEFEKFKVGLIALTREMKAIPIEGMQEIALEGARMGLVGKDLDAFTEAIAKASLATEKLTPARLAEFTGRMMIIFKRAPGIVDNYANALTELANETATTDEEIVKATEKLMGLAEVAGITEADLMGMAAAMRQAGQTSDRTTSALSALFDKLLTEPANVAKLLNLPIEDFIRLVNTDLKAAVVLFAESMKKMTPAEQTRVLKELEIGERRTAQALKALVSSIDEVKRLTDLSNKSMENTLEVDRKAAITKESLKAAIEDLSNAWKIFKIEMGSAESLKFIIETIKSLIDTIVKLKQELIGAIPVFNTFLLGLTKAGFISQETFIQGGYGKQFGLFPKPDLTKTHTIHDAVKNMEEQLVRERQDAAKSIEGLAAAESELAIHRQEGIDATIKQSKTLAEFITAGTNAGETLSKVFEAQELISKIREKEELFPNAPQTLTIALPAILQKITQSLKKTKELEITDVLGAWRDRMIDKEDEQLDLTREQINVLESIDLGIKDIPDEIRKLAHLGTVGP
jgi:TP901 family phage tail tape measure protein